MEDLKKYLAVAAKHSFWIISGLILILASVFFYLTKAELDQAISSRVAALNSAFNTIKTVSGKTATHPNKYSHDEMERRLALLKTDVDRAWEFQYDRQKKFLTWPTEAFADEKTYQIFDNLRPFEASVPFPLPDKLPPPLDAITRNDRAVYKGYIAPEFPALARMIGSSWKFSLDPATMNPAQGGFAPPGGGGGFTPPGFGATAAAQETKDLVRWSEESQKALATAVLPWFGRATPPDIHEIYYAQEDIWILRGLMDIIAQTNAGANENFQAIVKEIEWIRTGPRVSRDAGSLAAASSGAPAGGAGYGAGGPPSGYGGGGAGGMPSGYGGSAGPMGGKGGDTANAVRAAMRVDPADNRYVDANLKAISGAQLRAAIKDRAKNQDGVAKRVQVRMRVKVDERFGKLITECGNGKMMLEVLQVRYNTDPAPDPGAGGGGGGGGGASGGAAKPSFGGAGLGGGSGAGMMGDGENTLGSAALQSTEVNPGEISIEIYGLIYLFNPPPSMDPTNPSAPAPAGGAPAPPAANPPAANPPAANPPAANPPAANPPAANPPAGEVADMEAPASETPAGDAPASEPPSGDAPAEEPPAGEAPAGEDPPADPGTGTNPPTPPEPSEEGGGGLDS